MIRRFHSFVAIGGITGVSLTFFHPAAWAIVGAAIAASILLLLPLVLNDLEPEPPSLFVAFAWLAMTLLIALVHGAVEQLYNLKVLMVVIGGLLFGYFLSLRKVSGGLAWVPLCVFALYFTILLVLGRHPNDVFTRNSENYVSVVLLALFASAAILTRPTKVHAGHLVAAGVILVLSVWAAGRGGILATLLLTGMLAVRYFTQGRTGIGRLLITILAITAAAAAVYVGAQYLNEAGYLYRFQEKGLYDPSRLTILRAYFENIDTSEFLFGRNYYDDSVIGRWGFNLHNSYLDAWAHLGLAYLAAVVAALALVFKARRMQPVIAIAVVVFGLRALTDSQLIGGQYDFVLVAAACVLLRASLPGRERVQEVVTPRVGAST